MDQVQAGLASVADAVNSISIPDPESLSGIEEELSKLRHSFELFSGKRMRRSQDVKLQDEITVENADVLLELQLEEVKRRIGEPEKVRNELQDLTKLLYAIGQTAQDGDKTDEVALLDRRLFTFQATFDARFGTLANIERSNYAPHLKMTSLARDARTAYTTMVNMIRERIHWDRHLFDFNA